MAGNGNGTGTGTILLISTSTVRPAKELIDTERIELTPWDIQFLFFEYNQKGLLFHKPTNFENTTSLIHHLKTTLSRTLDFFYPLAGRLATEKHDDSTSSYFILCNNSGVEFTHAVAEGITAADVLDPFFVPDSFFPLNGVQDIQGDSKPLLAVRVTELVDGIFIGCTMNHVVVDGTSFWHFFNSWSEISRGDSNIPNNPPLLRRMFLDGADPPIRFHLSDEILSKRFARPPPAFLVKERVFHFKKEKIAALKAKANAECANNNKNSQISSLQALLSHLWRSVIRSRSRHQLVDPEQEIQYKMYIGDRTRMSPALPNHYFGNSIHGGAVTMRAGDLLQQGLGHVALRMNEMIASQTGQCVVRNFLESWVKSPNILIIGNTAKNYALTIGSSPRFNVYGTDFGWGMPATVRSGPANKFDGKMTAFPGKEEGSVVVEICLLAETLEALMNDSEFMDAVTV